MKRTIAKIGKASGTGATAHDCRRTFCYRWAKRVMPQTLRALARHSDVKTTLTYYADSDAEMTFDAVWDAVGVKTGDT